MKTFLHSQSYSIKNRLLWAKYLISLSINATVINVCFVKKCINKENISNFSASTAFYSVMKKIIFEL